MDNDTLLAIQRHFHDVIRGRAAKLIDDHGLVLPELAPLLAVTEQEASKAVFPIPGMYGGFVYWFEGEGADTKLVTESACRICGGSGQRHEITAAGSQLVAAGFV